MVIEYLVRKIAAHDAKEFRVVGGGKRWGVERRKTKKIWGAKER